MALPHLHPQAVTLAYDVLCDDKLRQTYDQYGLIALGPKYSVLKSLVSIPGIHQVLRGWSRVALIPSHDAVWHITVSLSAVPLRDIMAYLLLQP
jgi:hypothetical protein